MTDQAIHVIKLGGSLLDLPDLTRRLDAVRERCFESRALLIVGGGAGADAVRMFDAHFGLDEPAAHRLCIEAMRLNAKLVAQVWSRCAMVEHRAACDAVWQRGDAAIVDPIAWLDADAARGVTIPPRWTFTSDSIAAHIAGQVGARRLTLLKSTLPEKVCDVGEAVRAGLVDEEFECAATNVSAIDVIDLRHVQPTSPTARRALR